MIRGEGNQGAYWGCGLWKADFPCLGVLGLGGALQVSGCFGDIAPGSVLSAPELTDRDGVGNSLMSLRMLLGLAHGANSAWITSLMSLASSTSLILNSSLVCTLCSGKKRC